jgi:YVTN family beta-propeller protein
MRIALVVSCWAVISAHGNAQSILSREARDPGVITTGQRVTPAGIQSIFPERVLGISFGSRPGQVWVRTKTEVFLVSWADNRVITRVQIEHGPEQDWESFGVRPIGFDSARQTALLAFTLHPTEHLEEHTEKGPVQVAWITKSKPEAVIPPLKGGQAGALAIAKADSPSGERIAVLPLIASNKLAVIDLKGRRLLHLAPTGPVPVAAAVNHNGTVAYVSNWGGREPKAGESAAAVGFGVDADRVVVDSRGIAATGRIVRIDLSTGTITDSISVGLHPVAVALDEVSNRLYVANANSDSISVIDTLTQRLVRTLPIAPFKEILPGLAPNSIALSPDGSRLYVALGGVNAIAVYGLNDFVLRGLIPTAWYPNEVVLSADGKYLAVSSLLGVGSGSGVFPWWTPVKTPPSWLNDSRKRNVIAERGTVTIVSVPNDTQLADFSQVVATNARLHLSTGNPGHQLKETASDIVPLPVPHQVGQPSLIEHVVFIIKENHTYDEVFGGLGKGNGDPSLVMYGEDAAPNHQRLARQFVLFDNFYATGLESLDGHEWVTQANSTDYALYQGWHGRGFGFAGQDPIAYSSGGFLWDAAEQAGKTVRIFGEYVSMPGSEDPKLRLNLLREWKARASFAGRWSVFSHIHGMNHLVESDYPAFDLRIPDVVRAELFSAKLKSWTLEGRMPNLVIASLPGDHTLGTIPGMSSPKAMFADNDLALGRIIEALSASPFWKKMVIFVVEDDALGVADHVDGHRTVALAVSPYISRGCLDSTFYSQQSVLKTIELILGIKPLTIFDLIAPEMRACFSAVPDYTPYTAVVPKQSLFEVNPSLKALTGPELRGALDSMKMNFDIPDAAPYNRLRQILWHSTRGWKVPLPRTHRSTFVPQPFCENESGEFTGGERD